MSKLDTPEEELQKGNVLWPGHIYYDKTATAQMGCVAKTFASSDELNYWASENQGALFIDVKLCDDGSILALYTKTLNADEHELISERSQVIAQLTAEKRRERLKATEANLDFQKATHAKLVEFAKAGEHCLNNHGKQRAAELPKDKASKKGGDK